MDEKFISPENEALNRYIVEQRKERLTLFHGHLLFPAPIPAINR